MPMNWTDEADAKLFAAVLAVCEVKMNYTALAAYMGSECTAKAITHRIAGIKKKAAGAGTNASVNPASPAKRVKKAEPGDGSDSDGEESPMKKAKIKPVATPRPKGKKKAEAPTTPATPGDLEDGGVKLEADSNGEY